MTQRWSPYPDLTLCGGLALWLMAAQGAVAEVIDAEEQALREAASAGAFDDGTAQAHHSRAGRG